MSGRTIYLERRAGAAWSEQIEDQLVRAGYEVRPRDDAAYFARLNAVSVQAHTGELIGLPDPRWPGHAMRADQILTSRR